MSNNIIDKIQVSGVTYDIGGSGGGKAIEAGRGIAITTGETADTVSFNLPISADSNTFINAGVGNTNNNTALNILIGSGNTAYNGNGGTVTGGTAIGFGNAIGYIGMGNYSKSYSFAFGYGNGIQGGHSYTIGDNNNIGRGTNNSKDKSFLIGYYNTCTFNGDSSGDYIFGNYCTVSKSDEFALGKYNVSNTGSTDADRTFFSIGNGTANNARHNAFEIRQNGDIYLSSGGTDIKLQDHLGGGGGGSSYTAGDGIDITNDVISVTGKVDTTTYNTYTAATDTALTNKADTATTYTKTEVDTALASKQTTLTAGTGINITDNVISATGGNPTVELTQAEYDALVTAGTVSADTYYIITDAQGGDLSNYWTTAQTQSAINQATSGLQETLVSGTNIKTINNQSLLGSGNIDIQGGGGGGKAIEAGRGISVTTGETADTVSFNLPISANTNNSVVMGGKLTNSFTNNGKDCLMVGSNLTTNNGSDCCLVVGYNCGVNGDGSAVIGWNSQSTGDFAFAFGNGVSAKTYNTFAVGEYSIANNNYEASFGRNNVSNTGSTNADKTIFSVGNGTSYDARHNAFEIRKNGDIYCSDGTNDVKLQDYLQIKVVKLTQSAYDALSPNYDSNTLYIIKD